MTDPSNIVRLVVSGRTYEGWKSVRISPAIERQARDFELSITRTWPGQVEAVARVKAGDVCQVFIGPDLVLTGYVDATPIRYDGSSYTVSVRGRSKTADLVDCCPVQGSAAAAGASKAVSDTWAGIKGLAPLKTGRVVSSPASSAGPQWRGLKIESIAAALAKPYGVRVVTERDTGAAIPDHQIQQGETVYESIARMLLLRQLLSTDNENGDLVIIEPGSQGRAATALEVGKNIRAGAADLDYRGVFSAYVCKGQRSGSDDEFGAAVAEQSATADDARIGRLRVLVIRQSGQADAGTCADRVAYEKAFRAAKALHTRYTVAGWRQDDGQLWRPNQLVRVVDPLIGHNTDMLVAEVSWILDEQGQRTEMVVGPPDGYRARAGIIKPEKRQKGGGASWSDIKVE